ncbi:hypothetical protein KUTeg_021886 [Tegillarca granosa]|uniref:Uncharacterized protein n=1 Tax=Tegillarca granosa TaxID=220873 RepID=A0ABQ9E516_TEGGR|nr:hypothetical protein KUTeg_021886 [Tegillarca granosa]
MKMDLVEVMGEQNKKVPVLLTPATKAGLIQLNKFRHATEVYPENPYVFAKVFGMKETDVAEVARHMGHELSVHCKFYRLQDDVIELAKISKLLLAVERGKAHKYSGISLDDLDLEDKFIQGHEALKYVLEQVPELEQPESLKFPTMRKYLATVVQVFGMKETDVAEVARHMGHELSVHCKFYRLQDDVIELAKISKLLLAVERGKAHKYSGISLDDLDLEGTNDTKLHTEEHSEKLDITETSALLREEPKLADVSHSRCQLRKPRQDVSAIDGRTEFEYSDSDNDPDFKPEHTVDSSDTDENDMPPKKKFKASEDIYNMNNNEEEKKDKTPSIVTQRNRNKEEEKNETPSIVTQWNREAVLKLIELHTKYEHILTKEAYGYRPNVKPSFLMSSATNNDANSSNESACGSTSSTDIATKPAMSKSSHSGKPKKVSKAKRSSDEMR